MSRAGGARAWIALGSLVAVAALVSLAVVGAARPGEELASRAPARAADAAGAQSARPAGDYENVYARDYVGPETCAECHEDNFRLWRQSLHRSMNRPAREDREAVVGDFSGVRLLYGDGSAVFERRGGDHVMTFYRRGALVRRFRITRTIGSRYLQEYVGVQIEGPEPAGHRLYTEEIRLPFGYWLRERAWFHRQYFDSWYEAEYRADGSLALDPYAPDETPWAARCAWCHNTYPFELRLLRARGERPIGQGTEQYFELVRSRRDPALGVRLRRENLLPVSELVTVGISCESCHLGGREHAEELEPIRFVPSSPDLRRRAGAPRLAGGRESPVLVNTICAQCHSTPSPRYPSGAAVRNSSEALDLAAGACTSAIKCTDCHDPHRRGPGAGAPDQPRHLGACTGCHPQYAGRDAAQAHARHPAGVASCLDCHMPKIVEGVTDFVRSHRISTPGSRKMLAAGAPNACNLCHLDRSLAWTVRELERGWGMRGLAPEAWKRPNAGGEQPAGELWLASEQPTLRIVAAAAYARSPLKKAALPRLLERLNDPIAYYRMRMLFAVEDVLGRPLGPREYDPRADPARRARQTKRLLERFARGRSQ